MPNLPQTIDAIVQDRLNRLEEKLSLSEDLLEELNRLVATQQDHIAALARQVQRLRDEIASAPSGAAGAPRDEVPPHY